MSFEIKYWVMRGLDRIGPCSQNEVQELLSSESIGKDSPIYSDGWSEWRRTGEVISTGRNLTPQPRAAQPVSSPQEEHVIWHGSPSQIAAFAHYISIAFPSLIAFFLLLFLGYPLVASAVLGCTGLSAASLFYSVKLTKYEYTSQRIKIRTGFLTKVWNQLELYRVQDFEAAEPFIMQMFRNGMGNLTIISSDSSNPNLTLIGVENVVAIKEQLRVSVEKARIARGVRVNEIS
jgi:membrane protein YdbS with pleckstrin-like domain